MKDERIYQDYLDDLLEALQKSQQFIVGLDYDLFVQDDKTVFAVIRALEVVGEATKQIPDEVRQRYRHIPWREMAGMRDKLIHEYFGVDLEVVCKTVNEDVPLLVSPIEEIINKERTNFS
jgi:uncharacterized protein with HEPN domain